MATMKLIVEIDETIHQKLKVKAAREQKTLRALVEPVLAKLAG